MEEAMNKRIEELAEQAGIAVWGDAVYMYDKRYSGLSTVMAKFAKLIIRDCAEIAKTAEPWKSDDLILKHFGLTDVKDDEQ